MPNDSILAANMIGLQLDMYRWSDHWDRMRSLTQMEVSYALLQNRYNDVVQRYDSLRRDYEKLRQYAIGLERERDQHSATTADLQRSKAALEAENWKLRSEKAILQGKVKNLAGFINAMDPTIGFQVDD